jgi:hypothetical protein
MQPAVSMLDARDAYLAADLMRFGGANKTVLWRAFAQRGMGAGASTNTNADDQPKAAFNSPVEANATVTFKTVGENNVTVPGTIYVGRYEDRSSPIADTNGSTPLGATAKFVGGSYDFVVQADGYGLKRFTKTFNPGQTTTVTFSLNPNWASSAKGAVVTGPGTGQANVIDDSEDTNWTGTGTPVQGKTLTVDLGGGAHTISKVAVSAMLSPGQNRFTALRQFRIQACNGTCTSSAAFTTIFTSPNDAFPGAGPRPVAPDLIIRTFAVTPTTATHLRLVVLTNQCTGGPDFQGDQDNDPANDSDCKSGSASDESVRVAEFEAFSG